MCRFLFIGLVGTLCVVFAVWPIWQRNGAQSLAVTAANLNATPGVDEFTHTVALPTGAHGDNHRAPMPFFAFLPIVQPSGIVTFAVIGDFGTASSDEAAVAVLVNGWNPDFIVTVGDNNYPDGASSTIDKNIGQYYSNYIYPYVGGYTYTSTLPVNRFFPSLGNHDWNTADAAPSLSYFVLPGNERYYDVAKGLVHLFIIDSDSNEPDGTTSTSAQAQWLQSQLAASTACWKLVFFHHAPYSSSSTHGSTVSMRWPFQAWGADAVLAAHDHTYERVLVNNLPYFVNGLGGAGIYSFGTPIADSQRRYNEAHGAMRIIAHSGTLTFEFINVQAQLIDTYTLHGGCAPTVNR